MRALRRRSRRPCFGWKRLERMMEFCGHAPQSATRGPTGGFPSNIRRQELVSLATIFGFAHVRSNAHSYRNWDPRVGNRPQPSGPCSSNGRRLTTAHREVWTMGMNFLSHAPAVQYFFTTEKPPTGSLDPFSNRHAFGTNDASRSSRGRKWVIPSSTTETTPFGR